MAFFRKWKTHYKHKKFSSDVIDSEDWGLGGACSPFDQAAKLDLAAGDVGNDFNSKIPSTGVVDAATAAGADNDDEMLFASYDNLKYLGCTPIETKPSEKVTSEAIALVIANSKAGGRKTKTQKRVKLNVCSAGVEVVDQQSQDTLMRFSIYKISYCSVDGAHDHAFSFVGAERDPLAEEADVERLSCHVFLCAKRKVAHELTLMVARCFERAYQQWREAVVLQQQQQRRTLKDTGGGAPIDKAQILRERNGGAVIESRAEIHGRPHQAPSSEPLIDLAASDSDMRKYLQNTWVSFDDDSAFQVAAC